MSSQQFHAAPGCFIVTNLLDPTDPTTGEIFAEVKCTAPDAEARVGIIVDALNGSASPIEGERHANAVLIQEVTGCTDEQAIAAAAKVTP